MQNHSNNKVFLRCLKILFSDDYCVQYPQDGLKRIISPSIVEPGQEVSFIYYKAEFLTNLIDIQNKYGKISSIHINDQLGNIFKASSSDIKELNEAIKKAA